MLTTCESSGEASGHARGAPLDRVETPAAPLTLARLPWDTQTASADACAMAKVFLRGAPHADAQELARFEAEAADRDRALAWVAGLKTRTGTERAERVANCGWMELCFHPRTGAVGWRQRLCKDRCCPACAKRRAGRARDQLREHLVQREADPDHGKLAFVTFTHPKYSIDAEDPGEAVSRTLAEWRKLTNRRPFKFAVTGYVRAVECTYSRKGWHLNAKTGVPYYVKESGWHAHLHIILEIEKTCDAWEVEKSVRAMWCEIAGAEDQCQNWQGFTPAKIGQIAKYITKPFELPAQHAPMFFDRMAGRRLLQGGGTWADFTKHDTDPPAHEWIPQGQHVADLIDRCLVSAKQVRAGKPALEWIFRWVEDPDGNLRALGWQEPGPDELERQERMPVHEALARLLTDARSVKKRGPPCQIEAAAKIL